MRFNGLDLNLLVALHAMLTERNITRAANKLFLSQPATSNALSRLREYFQDELLVASGRQFRLTPRAEELLEPVREILMRIESTIASQPVFDPRSSTRLFTMLMSDLTLTALMPTLTALVYAEAPGVTLSLSPLQDDPSQTLEQGETDLMILPSQYLLPDHPSQKIFEETYVCITWEGNTRIRDHLRFEDYLAAGHVVAKYATERRPAFDGWFLERYGVIRRVEITTSSLTNLAGLVVGTDRIATVHKRLAERELGRLPIRIWPAPIEIPKLQQTMQWHRHRDSDAGLRWLRSCFVRAGAMI